jgi:hypothetical protein
MSPESDGDMDVNHLRSRGPGEDPDDPYENVDLSELPEWWRDAIEEFDQYGLRPYRPPRFQDGVLKHEVIGELEADHDIDIRFVTYNSQFGDNWEVQIDEKQIGEIERFRSPEGYTVFELSSKEFVEFVESNI